MSNTPTVALGDLMVSRAGTLNPAHFPDETFDLYSIPAYDSQTPAPTVGSDIGSPKQIVQPGDVLLSKIVPHIRRSWIVEPPTGRRLIASGEWIVFRGSGVHASYLRHVLLSDRFHADFMNTVAGVGGSLLRARPAFVSKIRVPLPSLPEQRRIAEVLDRADELRAKRHEALARLDELTRSIFLDMFGDPARNREIWPSKIVGDLLESATYGSSEKAGLSGDLPVLRMNNITKDGRVDLADLKYLETATTPDRYRVRSGDVLFNRTNSADLVGKAAIYRGSEPMAYAGYLVRLRVNAENNPEYLAAFLNTVYAKRVFRGMCKSIIGMANINAKELQSIRVAQPPLELQDEFAARVRGVEAGRHAHLRSLSELEALFASLQDRAFRGLL